MAERNNVCLGLLNYLLTVVVVVVVVVVKSTIVMTEVTPADEAPQVEQKELSQIELAPHAQRFLAEFRNILSTLPEFNQAAGQYFLNYEDGGGLEREIRFQLENNYYNVSADRSSLFVEIIQDPKELERNWWDRKGRTSESVIVVVHEGNDPRIESFVQLGYESPELNTPTPGFVGPMNTEAVIEKIEEFLAEFKVQTSAAR